MHETNLTNWADYYFIHKLHESITIQTVEISWWVPWTCEDSDNIGWIMNGACRTCCQRTKHFYSLQGIADMESAFQRFHLSPVHCMAVTRGNEKCLEHFRRLIFSKIFQLTKMVWLKRIMNKSFSNVVIHLYTQRPKASHSVNILLLLCRICSC